MKKSVLVLFSMFFIFTSCSKNQSEKNSKNTFNAKAGDTIYVCGCGEGCTCGSLAVNPGRCSCGNDLVKTKVTRVENGKVYYMVDKKELSAPIKGKYACTCKDCDCNTISQKPGKCSCSKELEKVK